MSSETASTIGAITGTIGAVAGVIALGLSIAALSRSGLANQRASLLVRWVDSTLLVTNLGPARARDVSVSVQSDDPARPERPVTIAALSNGYTHRVPQPRLLMTTDARWIELTWKDDRRRPQKDSVLVSQEPRTPKPHGPTIPNQQIDTIAARLGEGVGKALNQIASNAVRRAR